MNKFAPFLCFFILSLLFVNCKDDNVTCSQEAWIGSYELVGDAECEFASMGSIVFNDEIIISEGSTATSINWDGFEESFLDCSLSDGIVQLTLDGNTITSRIGECTKEYSRR